MLGAVPVVYIEVAARSQTSAQSGKSEQGRRVWDGSSAWCSDREGEGEDLGTGWAKGQDLGDWGVCEVTDVSASHAQG